MCVQMFSQNTNKHWKEWGKQNPYYGVVSHEKYKGPVSPEALEHFFGSGEKHVNQLLRTISKLFPMDWKNSECVDFGCGVGRLLLPLAAQCQRVTGIDISEEMLNLASRHAAAKAVHNVSFLTTEQWRRPLIASCDFVHSFIVFQHISVPEGLKTAQDLLTSLRPGGLAALHFIVSRRLGILKSSSYYLKHRIPGMLIIMNVLQGKQWNEPFMQMNPYNIEHILTLFAHNDVKDVVLVPDMQKGALGLYFIGRKTPAH